MDAGLRESHCGCRKFEPTRVHAFGESVGQRLDRLLGADGVLGDGRGVGHHRRQGGLHPGDHRSGQLRRFGAQLTRHRAYDLLPGPPIAGVAQLVPLLSHESGH